MAARVLCLGQLLRPWHRRVGHRTEGFDRRRSHVPDGDGSDDTDGHRALRDLLPAQRLCGRRRQERVPLQRGNGNPQSAAQTGVLLLRLPNVPRARRRLQRQLRFPHRIAKPRRLPVHRPTGRVHQPGQPLQPGRGQQTAGPHVLRAPPGERCAGFLLSFHAEAPCSRAAVEPTLVSLL